MYKEKNSEHTNIVSRFISPRYTRKISSSPKVSSKRTDEKEAIKKIESKCEEISTPDNRISFHGWTEEYRGADTKLILESSVYGKWSATSFKSFIRQSVSRPNRISKEYAENKIKEVCEEISTEKEKIMFRGFFGKFTGCSSRLVLYNDKLEIEWNTVTYSEFTSKKSKTPNLTREIAEILVIKKCDEISTEEEVISFLGFKGEWEGYLTHLVLHNSKTNETWNSTPYSNFMKKPFKGSKSDDHKKDYKNKREEHYREKILRVCKEISTSEETITFLGWKNNIFINNQTKIILHNSKYNITWDTTKCSQFIRIRNKLPNERLLKQMVDKKTHTNLVGRKCHTTEKFIKNYEEKFPNPLDRYDLSKAEYQNSYTKLIAICHEKDEFGNEHGEFLITPDKLLLGCGCQVCNTSSGEKRISNYLEVNNISYISQHSIDSSLIPGCPNKEFIKIDFSLEYQGRKIWIEFNGCQHYHRVEFFQKDYSDFEKQQLRDQSLREYARNQEIELLEIPYTDLSRIPEILDAFLKDGKDITIKI